MSDRCASDNPFVRLQTALLSIVLLATEMASYTHAQYQTQYQPQFQTVAATRPNDSAFGKTRWPKAEMIPAKEPASSGSVTAYYVRPSFRLPYGIQPSGRSPEALDLYASADDGLTWQWLASALPQAGAFEVTELAEGEYWMSVRPRQQQSQATISHTRKLRVIVDGTAPVVEYDCQIDDFDQLVVECVCQDAHLQLSSYRLYVRCDGHGEFLDTPVAKLIKGSDERALYRTTMPMPPCRQLEVMVISEDRAGNKTTELRRFAGSSEPSSEEPIALQHASSSNRLKSSWTPENTPVADITLGEPYSNEPKRQTDQSARHSRESGRPDYQLTSSAKQKSLESELEELPTPPISRQPEYSTLSTGELEREGDSAGLELKQPAMTSKAAPVPLIESRSRKLVLDYAVEPSIGRAPLWVELWASNDNGQTWSYWGRDEDGASPCKIDVGNDGVFGFCIVPITCTADKNLRPASGDLPDICVKVVAQSAMPLGASGDPRNEAPNPSASRGPVSLQRIE